MFEKFVVPKNLRPTDPRFGSGPSLVPTSFLEKLSQTGFELMGTSHRKQAVKGVVEKIRTGLQSYFNLDKNHEVILGNGGATFLFDMIGLGLVQKKSSHFTCGEFSEKWFKSHSNIPWIEAQKYGVDYGQGVTPKDDTDADMICCTLNETSTGVQIDQLPTLSSNCLLAVDATSGAGQVPCEVNQTDVFFFSPQKVFASDGGLFVSVMSQKAIERARELEESKNYRPVIMSWKLAIDNSLKDQTYNTPAIATLFFLQEQIAEMNKLGYAKVKAMAETKAKHIYSWADSKDYLNCYVKEDRYRSRAVATIDLDEKIPVSDLLKCLEEQNVAYNIDAYRKLGRNQIRVALFHNIQLEDLQKLTEVISLAIEGQV